MKLSQLRDRRVPLAIDVLGDVLNVVYNPSYITPEVEQEIADANSSEQMSRLLSGMLVEWDLVDDATNTPVGTDAETLRKLPTIILAHILGKVSEATVESVRAEGKESVAISAPTV